MQENYQLEEKFNVLYQLYHNLMFSIAFRISGNYEDAEEIVQEALIQVFLHINNIGDPRNSRTKNYVSIIVKHIAINNKIKCKKYLTCSFDLLDTYLNDKCYENILEKSEQIIDLFKSIETIPEQYKNVIVLKYCFGYHNDEIANILKLSCENVKKILQRARKKLLTMDILNNCD